MKIDGTTLVPLLFFTNTGGIRISIQSEGPVLEWLCTPRAYYSSPTIWSRAYLIAGRYYIEFSPAL